MKNGYFHIEIIISTAHMIGGMLPSRKILKNFEKCAIWCVLVYILIKFQIKIVLFKVIYCIEQYMC